MIACEDRGPAMEQQIDFVPRNTSSTEIFSAADIRPAAEALRDIARGLSAISG